MPFAPPAPVLSVLDIPFSYRGSRFGVSPVTAEQAYADDLHLVSHQTAIHVLETADLAAFLVLQSRQLAGLATELGRPDEAGEWTETADAMRAALLDPLWQDGRFVARRPGTGETPRGTSLLDLMAIALGAELPKT